MNNADFETRVAIFVPSVEHLAARLLNARRYPIIQLADGLQDAVGRRDNNLLQRKNDA